MNKLVRKKRRAILRTDLKFGVADDGLVILVKMPRAEALIIKEVVGVKKMTTSKSLAHIAMGLNQLDPDRPRGSKKMRDRSDTFQGEIPRDLKSELSVLALKQDKSMASIVRLFLACRLISSIANIPVKGRDWPKEFWSYVEIGEKLCRKAILAARDAPKNKRKRSLYISKFQMELSDSLKGRLKDSLEDAGVPIGHFIAGVIHQIIDDDTKTPVRMPGADKKKVS